MNLSKNGHRTYGIMTLKLQKIGRSLNFKTLMTNGKTTSMLEAPFYKEFLDYLHEWWIKTLWVKEYQ